MHSCTFQTLPRDMLLTILTFTDAKTAARMTRVCLFFNKIANDEHLWKGFVVSTFSPKAFVGEKKLKWLTDFKDYAAKRIDSFVKTVFFKSQPSRLVRSEWHTAFRELLFEWQNAKTQKEKEALASKPEFEGKKKIFAHFSALCICSKSASADCPPEIVEAIAEDEISLTWIDNNGTTPLHYALDSKNVKVFQMLIKTAKHNPSLYTLKSGIGTQIGPGFNALEMASFYSQESAPFSLLLDQVKTDKKYLKEQSRSFMYLVKYGRLDEALLFLKALDGDIDHFLEISYFHGKNFFHEIPYIHQQKAEELVNIFLNLKGKNETIKKLMLSKEEIGWLPLHVVCSTYNLSILKLYIAKMRELGILEECLNTPNSQGETPLDILNNTIEITGGSEETLKAILDSQ